MIRSIFSAFALLVVMTTLTGLIYPLAITFIAQNTMPYQANGSLIISEGRLVGSAFIGQNFTEPKYFHGRPSNAGEKGYDGSSSGGSNLGPTNKQLVDSIIERSFAIRTENGMNANAPVPADIVTASASGLDPDISPAAAQIQVDRIAKARGLDSGIVNNLIVSRTKPKQFGFLGDLRINVLELNLALDAINK